ncbi:MAG: class I SAM-dependent methyltransferase [Methanobacterium sp.]|nr:class I SAM-dependent methyltransferase [Methanobacterium sp.]
MNDNKQGHVHHSKSTKDIINAEEVLDDAGIKTGDHFLDAGCGDGFISIAASKMVGDEGMVYAIDVHPESVEMVKEEVKKLGISNMEVKVADLTHEIPLKDDSIDVCIMANVLHGFVENDEVEEVMNEISRVIKPEGTFSVVEFIKTEGTRGPPYNIRISPDELEDLLLPYKFQVTETKQVGEYHYLVRAVNKK